MLLVEWEFYVQLYSNHYANILKLQCFSCSTAVCIKGVCALCQGLTSVISTFHLLSILFTCPPSPPLIRGCTSSLPHSSRKNPAWVLVFCCCWNMNLKRRLVSEDYDPDQESRFDANNISLQKIRVKWCLGDVLQDVTRIQGDQHARFDLVSYMDLTNLIWSLFSENGTAADAFYRSTNRQTCIITGIEFILMCRRECFHN